MIARSVQPSSYDEQQIRHWKVRYFNAGAPFSVTSFSAQTLASMLGFTATSAVASFYLASAFKVRSVEIWGYPNTMGTPVAVACKATDNPLAATVGITSPTHAMTDTSADTVIPAHIKWVPPRGSFSSQWFNTNATVNILVMTLPTSAIVDFDFDFTIDDIGNTNSGPTIVGATAGNIYHRIVVIGGSTFTPAAPLNGI